MINSMITAIFDVILKPFSGMAPVWGLLTVSVLTGIVMVVIFKYTSNQAAIKSARNKISAYFLEVRLFKDDLGLMLDAQKRILRANLTYMRYSILPMLIMIVPVLLILVQLGIRYENRPLRPGETALVKLKLPPDANAEDIPLSVELSEGLRLETPLFKVPGEQEVDFKLSAVEKGEHELAVLVGNERVNNPIVVSDALERVYPKRTKSGLYSSLLAPGQKPLPAGLPLEEIHIAFPPRTTELLGWRLHWLVIFFVVSIAAGYSLKGVFKVQI